MRLLLLLEGLDDATYLELASDPERNATTLQDMVDTAALRAGFISRDGRPVKFYHGSRSSEAFDVFNTRWGAYFSSNAEYANGYSEFIDGDGDGNGPTYSVYLKVDNSQTFNGEVEEEFLKCTGERPESSALAAAGHDGQMQVFDDGEVEVRVNDPGQIKSANPVTYDDGGDVIPLSSRFDTSNRSIRY